MCVSYSPLSPCFLDLNTQFSCQTAGGSEFQKQTKLISLDFCPHILILLWLLHLAKCSSLCPVLRWRLQAEKKRPSRDHLL